MIVVYFLTYIIVESLIREVWLLIPFLLDEMTVHFSKEGLDKALAQGGLMMVDFWADWCGPCKMLSPVIEDLAGQYEGKAVVGKVNVDDEPELAMRYGVMSIPTVIFFKDGREIDRKVGVMPAAAFTQVLDANQ